MKYIAAILMLVGVSIFGNEALANPPSKIKAEIGLIAGPDGCPTSESDCRNQGFEWDSLSGRCDCLRSIYH